MDEWKRFANAAVQEELIAKAEALRAKYQLRPPKAAEAEDDLEKAARELHDIQERWKQVAEAPRAQAQALWHRYRQAADPIQAQGARVLRARAPRSARATSSASWRSSSAPRRSPTRPTGSRPPTS